MVATGDGRVGALGFGPDLSGPKRIVPWSEQNLRGKDLDLKGMLVAVQYIDIEEDLPGAHARFLARGSSLGGVRPRRRGKTAANNGSRNLARNTILKFGGGPGQES